MEQAAAEAQDEQAARLQKLANPVPRAAAAGAAGGAADAAAHVSPSSFGLTGLEAARLRLAVSKSKYTSQAIILGSTKRRDLGDISLTNQAPECLGIF